MNDRYLVVYHPNPGFANLSNVGIFTAESEEQAILQAREVWWTTGRLVAVSLRECGERWNYFS